jgi:spermidine synthase
MSGLPGGALSDGERSADLPRDPSFLIITAAGFAATVAQILLLRELLVLFYGNEMSTALVLAGWLLWTALGSAVAARLASWFHPREGLLALLLTLQALGLPALVLCVRGVRWLLGIPLGELAPMGTMLLVCLSVPVLFCPIAGALFGLCWAYRRGRDAGASSGRPLAIYLGEALGAAAGGIVFYFVMLRLATALGTAVIVALVLLAVSGWVLWRCRQPSLRISGCSVWAFTTLVVLAVAFWGGGLEMRSRHWQWGEHLVAVRDTPFHNIAVLQEREQTTVFTNGLWLLTQPDPATAELAVHPALLQHPDPKRVLLLGGGLAGHVTEVLKHPGIEWVEYVELDPELISFSQKFLTPATRESLWEVRVEVRSEDAGTFLRRTEDAYDVILMSVGDPINAQMNRFYTVELFGLVGQRLRPGGIFSFSVPGGGDLVGPTHARLLGSLDQTLREVFSEVCALPGERARFFAAGEEGTLVMDPEVLGARGRERDLGLVHLREDVLQDLMSPMRLDYLEAVLAELEESRINRQFSPVCYYHGMLLWASQWHPGLARWIEDAATIRPSHLFVGVGAAGLLLILFFWLGRSKYRAAVGASVLVQGAWGMVLQIVLILSFQILAGFAYLQLALIIAFFMAGLAVGTFFVGALKSGWHQESRYRDSRAIRWLAMVQTGVAALPLVLLVFLSPLGEGLREGLSPVAASWVFTAVSFVAGVIGGSHFSLAVLASAAAGARLERTGGYLYALDLAGAAGGAVVAGLFLLPLFGVASTLVLLSLLASISLVTLLRRPPARAEASPASAV